MSVGLIVSYLQGYIVENADTSWINRGSWAEGQSDTIGLGEYSVFTLQDGTYLVGHSYPIISDIDLDDFRAIHTPAPNFARCQINKDHPALIETCSQV